MVARRLTAGFLAGASTIVGILAILVLLLLAAGLFGFFRDFAARVYGDAPFWQSFWRATVNSFGALPGYFWSARWGMVALGLFGLILAVVDSQRPRINRPWRDQLGWLVTVAAVTALVVGVQYANREAVNAWVADHPELFTQQETLLVSDAVLLATSLFISLALTYIVWVAWNFWFERWASGLRVWRPEPAPASTYSAAAATAASSDDWREYQRRLRSLKAQDAAEQEPATQTVGSPAYASWTRYILAGLALATLLGYVLLQVYHSVGPEVRGGQLWVTPDSPAIAADLRFRKSPHRVILSNTAGSGRVDVRLTGGSDGAVRQIEGMQFAGAANRFQTATLDLNGLPAGTYQLTATLREGEGGLLRYMSLFGGGVASRLAAVAFGLTVGLWAALAFMLFFEVRASRR